MKHGKGTYVTNKGVKYVGQYEKNKRNGYGEITSTSGNTVTKGLWVDDALHKKQ